MAVKQRRVEISILNLLFCLLVIWIHCCSHPVTVLDHSSWKYGVIYLTQRLSFVSVYGFFFLSGVKLTLGHTAPPSALSYLGRRGKAILLPYLLAVVLYYLFFVWRGYFPFSLTDLSGYAIRGDLASPFYFVIALTQFILLAPLFRWLARTCCPAFLLPMALGVGLISGQCFNDVLHLLSPTLNFAYSDRIFTTYLLYYLAGCFAGQYYDRFLELLRKNTAVLLVCAGLFTAANALSAWRYFVDGVGVSYFLLELFNTLYLFSAILALYALALRFSGELPAPLRSMDRATFLVYLYHPLVITCFNSLAGRLGIVKVSTQFVLRVLVVYTVTFLACILWQQGYSRVKTALRPSHPN